MVCQLTQENTRNPTSIWALSLQQISHAKQERSQSRGEVLDISGRLELRIIYTGRNWNSGHQQLQRIRQPSRLSWWMDGCISVILPSTSTQNNLQKIHNHYHCSAAPSAIEIGLLCGQLHLQKNTRADPNNWFMDKCFHHPSLRLHPKKWQQINKQYHRKAAPSAISRNSDRQRPAAPAKNTRAGGAVFKERMAGFLHHSPFRLHSKIYRKATTISSSARRHPLSKLGSTQPNHYQCIHVEGNEKRVNRGN